MGKKPIALKLDNYKPLREIVFEALRESILDGSLAPGERLMETQLAEDLGVSRTPVREAIRKLELEGLVVMVPRRGAYVASMSIKDIAETFEIRSVLESLAARLAADRMTKKELDEMEYIVQDMNACIEQGNVDELVELDERFHDIIITASRNNRLAQIVSLLREQIKRFRQASLATKVRQQLIFQEHKSIIKAISEHNCKLAQELVQEHIANAEQSLMEVIRRNRNIER